LFLSFLDIYRSYMGHDSLQLRATNGLGIPYIGYVELDVELYGELVPKCGVPVVKGCISLAAHQRFTGRIDRGPLVLNLGLSQQI